MTSPWSGTAWGTAWGPLGTAWGKNGTAWGGTAWLPPIPIGAVQCPAPSMGMRCLGSKKAVARVPDVPFVKWLPMATFSFPGLPGLRCSTCVRKPLRPYRCGR